ncbi:MAG: hypothetical protein JNK89_10695 [Saprospiraceae bacterium]|nr:hypothetical protein [Saprospiraceae bacterium]
MRALSAEEYEAFARFADSPYFNSDKRIAQLLRLLQPAHPDFRESPATAINRLAKALGFNSEEGVRQLRTRTLKLLPAFYAQQELARQPNTARLLLLDALQHRRLEKPLRDEIDAFETQIDPDDRPFHTRLRLDNLRLDELLRNQSSFFVFEQYIASCNRYFLLEKLKQGCQLLLFQQVYKKTDPHALFDELDMLLPVQEPLIRESAALSAWALLFGLLKNPQGQNGFLPLQHYLAQHGANIPKKERKDLFRTAANLLTGKLTKGHFNTLEELNWFYRTQFEQFQLAESEGWLIEDNGFMLPGRFKNVVAAACNCGQTAWAKNFLRHNQPFLPPEQRSDLLDLCLGSVAFYEGDYQQAAEHLARVPTRDNEFYFFDTESVRMRIFYLENDYDLFESRHEAVRRKLKVSELAQVHRDNYGNYFRFLREMFLLKINPETTAAHWSAFRQKVEAAHPVNQKKWLLERLPE